MINFVLLYLIPLCVMTVLYTLIAVRLWNSGLGYPPLQVRRHVRSEIPFSREFPFSEIQNREIGVRAERRAGPDQIRKKADDRRRRSSPHRPGPEPDPGERDLRRFRRFLQGFFQSERPQGQTRSDKDAHHSRPHLRSLQPSDPRPENLAVLVRRVRRSFHLQFALHSVDLFGHLLQFGHQSVALRLSLEKFSKGDEGTLLVRLHEENGEKRAVLEQARLFFPKEIFPGVQPLGTRQMTIGFRTKKKKKIRSAPAFHDHQTSGTEFRRRRINVFFFFFDLFIFRSTRKPVEFRLSRK